MIVKFLTKFSPDVHVGGSRSLFPPDVDVGAKLCGCGHAVLYLKSLRMNHMGNCEASGILVFRVCYVADAGCKNVQSLAA